jgi:hypothetical protein
VKVSTGEVMVMWLAAPSTVIARDGMRGVPLFFCRSGGVRLGMGDAFGLLL